MPDNLLFSHYDIANVNTLDGKFVTTARAHISIDGLHFDLYDEVGHSVALLMLSKMLYIGGCFRENF